MSMAGVQGKEGTVDFEIASAGKLCQTWYRVFGDLDADATKRPLVAVHGGPGLTHHAMLPLADLSTKHSIPVVLYDQIGNGNSTHLPEKNGDESFWTEALFHSELTNLISKLGLQNREFDLLGHSWGGMMLSTYAALFQPPGLRKLVLANAPADLASWSAAYFRYREGMPADKLAIIVKYEDAGDFTSDEYESVLMEYFFSKHVCTVDPWPQELLDSFAWVGKDGTVSHTMMGYDEFRPQGSLKDWSSVNVLHQISVPTLVINGVDEGADDSAIKPFLDKIPDVTWKKLEKSSHCPQFEDRELYIKTVAEWLLQE
ncbi:hypothetical protein BP5796_06352 [Coleophoma crateriformis]|uniref:AB hydrolase-1 domain-containing protein n=1 Tax=Coleophoma crateriformis TaxID=565419 RepID=A0A3D8RX41_9HELO|nr:hypothetical protein BP5796_06352 [Coleophoma crateriformis]